MADSCTLNNKLFDTTGFAIDVQVPANCEAITVNASDQTASTASGSTCKTRQVDISASAAYSRVNIDQGCPIESINITGYDLTIDVGDSTWPISCNIQNRYNDYALAAVGTTHIVGNCSADQITNQ